MPVLLYGCENWILTDSLLHKFQAEIGHRMLQLSRYHSCLSTHLALQWPSVATRILVEKLCLLSKVCQDGGTIGSQIYSALKEDKGHSLMLIQECQSLEGKLASHGVTDTIINNQSTLKKQLLKKDWECCVVQASQHASTAVKLPLLCPGYGPRLWDQITTGPIPYSDQIKFPISDLPSM